MPAMLTYAIGDIHGSYRKLRNLLDHCKEHRGATEYRIVFLGDYIDRGPHSREVVDLLIETQSQTPDHVICLRGNHEDMLLNAINYGDHGPWLANGGAMTLASYGVGRAGDILPAHLEWFRSLPLATADEKRFFVHAGVRPGVPLQQQSEEDLLWIREPFLSDPRHHGLYVVHGHTPVRSGVPELRRNRLNLDTGAYLGGPLTAAMFDETAVGPKAFITDDGVKVTPPALASLEQA
jgi:serine/threonine protein phosphatase 1